MVRKMISLSTALSMFLFGIVYPAPVDLPSAMRNLKSITQQEEIIEESKIAFLFDGEFDYVKERELSVSSDAEVKGKFYTGKIIYSFLNKIDIYGIFGQAQDIEGKATIEGSNYKVNLEDKFTWGTGLSAILYEWEDYGIKLFSDFKYRRISNMDVDSVTVDGTTYDRDGIIVDVKGKWEEVQFALGIGRQFNFSLEDIEYSLIPYIGMKYSDLDFSAKTTVSGDTYELSSDSDKEIGVFLGCSIASKTASIDLEARFVDETAFTARISFKL